MFGGANEEMRMNYSTLIETIAEAERFLAKAKKLAQIHEALTNPTDCMYNNPVEQGAARRASMDLTRKLADLRAGR